MLAAPLFDADLLDGLVIVGSKGWLYDGFFRQVAECPHRERVHLPGFVSEEDLPAVYAGAAVTVQPSVYEGFGLPVLEAMASGGIVCASKHHQPAGDRWRGRTLFQPDRHRVDHGDAA